MSYLILSTLIFVSLFSSWLTSPALSAVPVNNTFKYVNAGDFGDYNVEYDASYRPIPPFESPFQMCFYNTTPNAYTLALRMGNRPSEYVTYWVWEANRGKPVGENAVFGLGTDGNMYLAEADGRIVWQTNTANKGVVGFDILPNGNIVLFDAKKKYVWQSFDSPTDTLLVDQYLKLGGPVKLVSRASTKLNADGAYSLVLEPSRLAMYYSSPLDSKPYLYFSSLNRFTVQDPPLKLVTLRTSPKSKNAPVYEISLNYQGANPSNIKKFILSRPNYNPVQSYLRLGIDGNLKAWIFDDRFDWPWDNTFTLFSRDAKWESECQLPSRCGGFGLCENNQCVACPAGNFVPPFLAWNSSCSPPTVKSCSPNDFVYKKLVGVDHFVSTYTAGDGPTTLQACAAKCTNNCRCKGYFYHIGTSKCWAVNELKTLIGVNDTSHLAFLKAPK